MWLICWINTIRKFLTQWPECSRREGRFQLRVPKFYSNNEKMGILGLRRVGHHWSKAWIHRYDQVPSAPKLSHTVTPLEPCCYLICLRRGHVCKGPFWWFSHFNAYQDHLGSYTFKQICRWFQSRWSDGTLGNSASKNHAGSLDQNVMGHAQESLFSQTHRLILTYSEEKIPSAKEACQLLWSWEGFFPIHLELLERGGVLKSLKFSSSLQLLAGGLVSILSPTHKIIKWVTGSMSSRGTGHSGKRRAMRDFFLNDPLWLLAFHWGHTAWNLISAGVPFPHVEFLFFPSCAEPEKGDSLLRIFH